MGNRFSGECRFFDQSTSQCTRLLAIVNSPLMETLRQLRRNPSVPTTHIDPLMVAIYSESNRQVSKTEFKGDTRYCKARIDGHPVDEDGDPDPAIAALPKVDSQRRCTGYLPVELEAGEVYPGWAVVFEEGVSDTARNTDIQQPYQLPQPPKQLEGPKGE